eukprot:Skav215425  [mRNA]  locus=scaffold745:2532:3818:+ [translate_table: standard]
MLPPKGIGLSSGKDTDKPEATVSEKDVPSSSAGGYVGGGEEGQQGGGSSPPHGEDIPEQEKDENEDPNDDEEGSDDNDDDDGDDSPSSSDSEEVVQGCGNCEALQLQNDKLALRIMALEIIIKQGFKPSIEGESREDLERFLTDMKALTQTAQSKVIDLYRRQPFAVIATCVLQNERVTREVAVERKDTIKAVKIKILNHFNIPVNLRLFTFTLERGDSVVMLDQTYHRRKVSTQFKRTAFITFGVSGLMGGAKTIKTDNKKTKKDFNINAVKEIIEEVSSKNLSPSMTAFLKDESDKVGQLFTLAEKNEGAGTGHLVAMKKLIREVPLVELKSLTTFESSRVSEMTDELCDKLLKFYVPKLEQSKNDIELAMTVGQTYVRMIVTQALMTPAGKMNWQGLEKLIEVDMEVRDAMASSSRVSGGDVKMT